MTPDKQVITSRRSALRKMFQSAGFVGMGGILWSGYLDEAKAVELILRPPAALDEENFLKACIKCGVCVEECPYDTLKLAKAGDSKPIGTPYFIAREVPCYMCPDIPCVPVCPTNALDETIVTDIDEETKEKVLNINKSKMGVAVIDKENCIAFWGIQCDACYRACPLLDEAIVLKYEKNERTGKHAFLKPEVQSDICTGCGMCEHACVTEKAAIYVLPKEIALGKVGDHYIKGWDKEDEKRLKEVEGVQVDNETSDEALDYLNNWEDLIDE